MTGSAYTQVIATTLLLFFRGVIAVDNAHATNEKMLHAHFRGLIDKQAHSLKSAAPLPLAAAGPILRVDLKLASHKPAAQAAFFEAMLQDETDFRTAAPSGKRFPYVLCGPQSSSKSARREISTASGPLHRTQVMYSSRPLDVACWKGYLRNSDAAALEALDLFYHVAPLPKISKLAPGLVQRLQSRRTSEGVSEERLAVHELALSQGITVFFNSGASQSERTAAAQGWNEKAYGLSIGTAAREPFVPSKWAKSMEASNPWVAANAAELDCASILAISPAAEYDGFGSLHLKFEAHAAGGESVGACVIKALMHVASSSEVAGLEVTKKLQLEGHEKSKLDDLLSLEAEKVRELESSLGGGAEAMNYAAATALQSADSSKPFPFWDAGINGTNQYVQVTDTGFDDASCFFRDTDASASVLTGPFNFNVQLARSTYNSPVTDLSRRKIVQYIQVATSSDTYGYDYQDGHGTHVAGTVAGKLASNANTVTVQNYFSLCYSYPMYFCDMYFCPTCGTTAHYCDEMCGFLDNETFTGMAPAAKVMAFDFGDGNGGLLTPSDYDSMMYAPAHDAGARISCNSWGSVGSYTQTDGTWLGSLYDYYSVMMDTLIYDYNDELVIFAAGNDGQLSYYTDDTTGDKSILDPGTTKNVLTVGAAETNTSPETVATFSSRGPTTDNRIKPDLCGPGNPIYSASSSGAPGNATCEVSQKSGTSMAAPAIAGVAALLRQALVDGKHQIYSSVGYADSDYNTSQPSSALLKAMLIGSTMPLVSGYNSTGHLVNLDNFYSGSSPAADTASYALGTPGVDYHQGFGHVLLSNVFSLDSLFETYLYESALDAYGTFSIEFTVVTTATEIDFTLAWTDPPGSEYCDYYTSTCLVHDLDLRVTHAGTRLYSNFGAASTGTYVGAEDTQNNVEKTTIASSALSVGDVITVVVATDSGLAGYDYQNFALVATGNIERSYSTPSPTAFQPTPPPVVAPYEGVCFSRDSTVSALMHGSQSAKSIPISKLKAGTLVLAADAKNKKVFTKVLDVRHSPASEPYLEIHVAMDSKVFSTPQTHVINPYTKKLVHADHSDGSSSKHLRVTRHHTFPVCHEQKLVPALALKVGDCLHTAGGRGKVTSIAPSPITKSDVTYTLVLDEGIDKVAVGGVFTQAMPEHLAQPKSTLRGSSRHSTLKLN